VPPPVTYVVVAGDGLFRIAEQNCVQLEALIEANGWTDGVDHTIRPGDVVQIPGGGCSAPSTVATETTVVATIPATYTLPYGDQGRHQASSPACNAAYAAFDAVFAGPPTGSTDEEARAWMTSAFADLRVALEPLAAQLDLANVLDNLAEHEPDVAVAYVTFLRDTTNVAAYTAMVAAVDVVGLARYALAVGLTDACPPA
jgi:LysM repeat protein